MADKPSGSRSENMKDKPSKRRCLTLQEVLDAVLDDDNELSHDDILGGSSFDETSGSESDEGGEMPIQNVASEDAFYTDSSLHLDVS